ncbi:MAG: calcium-binding EGF-like domain-containing protein [Nannocystaceae bacterium]
MSLKHLSPVLSAIFVATLAGCSGDDGTSTAATASASDGSTGDSGETTTTTSTSDATATDATAATTTTTTTTTDGTTASTAADPCDACDANATCDGNSCTCKDGFDGDGKSCADLDECASGKNQCDPDATCTNTPGSYTCACNDGYKGNGMTCKDIDECSDGTDMCATYADCANKDGGYTCTCQDGFTGDGFTCNGSKKFGEVCSEGEECSSGVCFTDLQCTVYCSIEQSANDCRDQGYYGLCVFVGNDQFACYGDIKTGADKDDAILGSGDSVTRTIQQLSDIDVFLIKIPMGKFQILVTPEPDDDIAVEFYNIDGSLLAKSNDQGVGGYEGVNVNAGGDPLYAVVSMVGNTNGSYKVSVTPM